MDPYEVLGVRRDASQTDIKRAYRKLAKTLHPDLRPDDKANAEKFKAVTAAYDLLGDKDKRAAFDRGDIDAEGRERGPRFHDMRAAARPGGGSGFEFGGFSGFANPFANADGLFSQLFAEHGPKRVRRKGADRTYAVNVAFVDAAKGGKRRLTLAGGKTLDVNIPAGIGEGQSIRLKGQGDPGPHGAPPGDAILKVHIVPHPYFTRQGDNIHVDVPVTLSEALSGARIEVPTLDGPVTMTVPKGSNSGKVLRLKGRGIGLAKSSRRGDQFVRLVVVLPEAPDDELRRFAAEWERAHPYAVRGKLSEE